MTRNLLSVVAEMVAKPGKEEELKRHLIALVAPTLQEEGCVQYDLHQSTGSPADSCSTKTGPPRKCSIATRNLRISLRFAASVINC